MRPAHYTHATGRRQGTSGDQRMSDDSEVWVSGLLS